MSKYKTKTKPNTPLSAREHEVAARMMAGDSNKIIADKLHMSEHTAKFHVANVIVKLGAKTRVDAAVKYALRDLRQRDAAQEKWFEEQQAARYG